MDMLLIVLSTAIGTVVGVAASILMTQRKGKQPTPGVAVLKDQLQKVEAALAAATANSADLQKQIAERDRTLEAKVEEMQAKQRELDHAVEHAEKAIAARTALEEKIQQGFIESGPAVSVLLPDANQEQSAALQAELEAARRKAQDLAEEGARMTLEMGEYRRALEAASNYRSTVEAELNAERERAVQLSARVYELEAENKHVQVLNEEAARLSVELNQQSGNRVGLEAELHAERERSTKLEAELNAERERLTQLAARVSELEIENEKVKVLTEEAARLTSELNLQSGNQGGLEAGLQAERARATQLEAELKAEQERATQLAARARELEIENEQVKVLAHEAARVTVELAELKRNAEADGAFRASLETELLSERAKVKEFSARLENAEAEFSQYKIKMQEEQEAARKGIDLLVRAQSELAHALGAFPAPGTNGHGNGNGNGTGNGNGHKPAEVVADAPAYIG